MIDPMDRIDRALDEICDRYARIWAAWASRGLTPVSVEDRTEIAPPAPVQAAQGADPYDSDRLWALRMRDALAAGRDPGQSRGYIPPFAAEVRLAGKRP